MLLLDLELLLLRFAQGEELLLLRMGATDFGLRSFDLGAGSAQSHRGFAHSRGVSGEESLTLARLGRILRGEDEEHWVDVRIYALELHERSTEAQEQSPLAAMQTTDVPREGIDTCL